MIETLSPAGILFAALLFDTAVGDPHAFYDRVPHPVALIGRGIAALDARWNLPELGPEARRRRGVALVLTMAGGMAAIGLALHGLALALPYGWVVEALCVYLLIAQKDLYVHVRAVARALRGKGLAAGRAAVGWIVGRDTALLDESGVCRAAIESCAESYSDGIISPVFWYVVLGLPGLCAFKAVSTLDSMVGHKTEKYIDFGRASALTDDAMNWVPARLAGAFLCIAAALWPKTGGRAAWHTMRRDAKLHDSPNAGWPECAMAGALGVKLLGPRVYPGGEVIEAPWVGDGEAEASIDHICRALRLYATACAISGGLAIGVLAFVG
ncbi:MAG: adenosylcobinamide-phosphate synthase CbiB [Rhodospirillaceae bacterium]